MSAESNESPPNFRHSICVEVTTAGIMRYRDDEKEVAPHALVHGMIMKAESWVKGPDPRAVVDEVLKTVPIPWVKEVKQKACKMEYSWNTT